MSFSKLISCAIVALLSLSQVQGQGQGQGQGSTWTCTATLNGGTRNCCPDTGLCQDSSCTVFGFKNSAKANCHTSGANPNCAESYCEWQQASCIAADTSSNHCYGRVRCKKAGSTSCYGYGELCLEDGNSANFKICGNDCNTDSDCPSGSTCVKTQGDGVCKETNPGSPDTCCPAGSATCQDLDNSYPSFLTADIPNADWSVVNSVLQGYGCVQESPNCFTLICPQNIPYSVLNSLYAVNCTTQRTNS